MAGSCHPRVLVNGDVLQMFMCWWANLLQPVQSVMNVKHPFFDLKAGFLYISSYMYRNPHSSPRELSLQDTDALDTLILDSM